MEEMVISLASKVLTTGEVQAHSAVRPADRQGPVGGPEAAPRPMVHTVAG